MSYNGEKPSPQPFRDVSADACRPQQNRVAILGAIEYGWNVFPSTLNSSMGLTFANAFLLAGVYYGHPTGLSRRRRLADADEEERKTQ